MFSIYLVLILLTIPVIGKSQSLCGNRYNNFIPDSTTAIKVAESILTPLYGTMANERPLRAELIGDTVWSVHGTLPLGWKGGVAEIEILKSDGKVLFVCHGK